MKKTLLTLALAFVATLGFAQATGSAEAPLTCADFFTEGAATAVDNCYLKAYIVGSMVSPGGEYETQYFVAEEGAAASGTNILVADSKTETDVTKMIPLQLPKGDVRTALNLKDNTGLIGKCAIFKGQRALYFKVVGLKSVTEYTWVSEGTEDPNGVAAIEADGEAVYFNLQGVRVAQPEKGLYIRVANGKATKVVK